MARQRQIRTIYHALLALVLAACESNDDNLIRQEVAGSTMGTGYSADLVTKSDFATEDLDDAIAKRLLELESSLSTYLRDSDLSRFNASTSTDWIPVTKDLCTAVMPIRSAAACTCLPT